MWMNEDEELTAAQKRKIEANRKRAKELLQSRVCEKIKNAEDVGIQGEVIESTAEPPYKMADSGAGFFIDYENYQEDIDISAVVFEKPLDCPVDLSDETKACIDCTSKFHNSFLFQNFNVMVCETCRQKNKESHPLITKTEAKKEYVLKDSDFKMENPLLFISRKNPRNSNWGEMHLYYLPQVKARALEVWKSMEVIEEEKIRRETLAEQNKRKRFDKKVSNLRKAVRSSLWTKDTSAHEHSFGPEKEVDEDTFQRKCLTCDFVNTYEKL